MVRHTSYDLGVLEAGEIIEVALTQNAANVRLLTKEDYHNLYLEDKTYNFYGGIAAQNPYTLSVPSKGHWYLAIDMQGLAGTASFTVTVTQNHQQPKTCPFCHNSLDGVQI